MNWLDIEGWFSEQDAEFVKIICSNIDNGIVVELGVFAGRSTAVMAPICSRHNTTYFAIDNFSGSDNQEDEATVHQQQRNIRELFELNMREMNLLSRIKVVQADSATSSSMFRDNSVNFCFMDADHSPIAVQRDIEAWWPKITDGGFIGGHDYPSPLREIVDKFVKTKAKGLLTGGRCWGLQKGSTK